ncbi:MAG: class I SAM-dependent methyltransferase [Anaerolineae bacterium]|nr:class I SAM-dependent methyltransferase [Thermoflexales bacterium]MDW8406161.1 class I SAM-dependent methyltransferase [Anaerolineae bacterium]
MTAPPARLLDVAWQRRSGLHDASHTTAYRLINREGDGLPDLAVDRYGDVLVAHVYSAGRVVDPPMHILRALAERAGARAVYVKYRPAQANVLSEQVRAELAPLVPIWGEAVACVVALEGGLSFEIHPADGLNPGLFLDMRDVRSWVRAVAAGKTVLNTFAYTCAFGVAAMAGGAARVLNLDISRRVLEWGARNYALNNLPAVRTDFVSGDVFDWLRRFARREERFDMVILDPPSFSTTRLSRFSVERDLTELVRLGAQIVQPDGVLIVATNHHQMAQPAFHRRVREGLRESAARVVRTFHEPAPDFPLAPGQQPYLKVMAVRIGEARSSLTAQRRRTTSRRLPQTD